jgi:alpha,alpha-trehalase
MLRRFPSLRPIRTSLVVALIALGSAASGADVAAPGNLSGLRAYIKRGWTTLTRSVRDLPNAAPDPKLHLAPGERWPVYLPPSDDRARVQAELARNLTPAQLATIELLPLPENRGSIARHGLLYLPHPYVVPGGRFNEMYGWDSYFIQVGLLLDGETELARDMADNFVYEIENYGTLLNANRTYYLSRSQPPFLTQMLLGVYRKTQDRAWLGAALPAVEKYYRFWTTEPHLIPELGLSRYYDLGDGPAPEVLSDERDAKGLSHYDRVREYYRTHEVSDYDVSLYYDRKADRLTELFYKGDRSMRESGFDPSNRFGPFNVDIIHYAPVCLNSLLLLMETDGRDIARLLGDAKGAAVWEARAEARRAAIDRYLWDAESGLYLDYDFKTGKRRNYPFATTFYPLWVGAASTEQAASVVKHLPDFEAVGGLRTSTRVTGNQWDAPFGWAPLQQIPVLGLQRYGYVADADRIARKWIALVAKEFDEHGTIVEKYDVERRESDVASDIRFGYSENQVGFGWTNGSILVLLDSLERSLQAARGDAPDELLLPDEEQQHAGYRHEHHGGHQQ